MLQKCTFNPSCEVRKLWFFAKLALGYFIQPTRGDFFSIYSHIVSPSGESEDMPINENFSMNFYVIHCIAYWFESETKFFCKYTQEKLLLTRLMIKTNCLYPSKNTRFSSNVISFGDFDRPLEIDRPVWYAFRNTLPDCQPG